MNKTKTEVYLFGGLGNQLFQYFFGQYLLREKMLDVKYNDELSRNFGNNHGNKLLDCIDLKNEESQHNSFPKVSLLKIRMCLKIVSIWPHASKLFGKSLYISSISGWNEELTTEDIYHKYFGYFQTWKFFESVKGKEIFFSKLKSNFSRQFDLSVGEIESNKSIGIHLRRGDYLQLSDTYGLLDIKYYEEALIQFNADKTSTVYVFSDDIVLSKNFFNRLEGRFNFRYLEGLSPVESLLLIGKCEKVCISNSTFGYWGALLGDPTEVIAPSKWYRNMSDPADLIPVDWKKINSIWEH